MTYYGNREILYSNGFYIEVFRRIYLGFVEIEDNPGFFDEWFGKFYQEYPGRYDDWQELLEALVSVFGFGHEWKYPGGITLLIRKTVDLEHRCSWDDAENIVAEKVIEL